MSWAKNILKSFSPRHLLIVYTYYLMTKVERACREAGIDCKPALNVLDDTMTELMELSVEDVEMIIRG